MAPKIFISYSSKDYQFVSQIVKVLDGNSFQFWFDKKDIDPSDKWIGKIEKGLIECSVVIICIGKEIKTDRFQGHEIDAALIRNADKKCIILPVLIPGHLKGNSPLLLQRFQYIDLTEGLNDNTVSLLIQSIKDIFKRINKQQTSFINFSTKNKRKIEMTTDKIKREENKLQYNNKRLDDLKHKKQIYQNFLDTKMLRPAEIFEYEKEVELLNKKTSEIEMDNSLIEKKIENYENELKNAY